MAASKRRPKGSASGGARKSMRPGRALAVMAVLLIGGGAAMVGAEATTPRLAIDLAGGTSVTLTAKPLPAGEGGGQGELTEESLDQAVSIIRQRVNGFGVSEAEVTTLGSDNIVVSVPGLNNSEIVQQVGQTALLRFRQVLRQGPPQAQVAPSAGQEESGSDDAAAQEDAKKDSAAQDAGTESDSNRPVSAALRAADDDASPAPTSGSEATPEPSSEATGGAAEGSEEEAAGPAAANIPEIPEAVEVEYAKLNCLDPANRQGGDQAAPDEIVVACQKDGFFKFILGPSEVQGTEVSSAEAGLPQGQSTGNWLVSLNFNGSGTEAWADMTSRVTGLSRPNNQIAITLDGVVYSAPEVQNAIPNGRAEISGGFTQETSNDLAQVLKYGALPLAFEKSTISNISATLGGDQLRGGLIAGFIGVALVVAYCIFFYRGLGITALVGLSVAGAMSYMTVSLLGEAIGYRLSIAGVAGLIVAIGITADSFVVYFERLRDEIRNGRTPHAAVEYGWVNARRTILSANFVSILAAAVLYYFSVAEVKGFAFTLGVATLLDIVVIFLFTKPLVTLQLRMPVLGRGHRFSGVHPDNLGMRRRMRPAPVAAGTAGAGEA